MSFPGQHPITFANIKQRENIFFKVCCNLAIVNTSRATYTAELSVVHGVLVGLVVSLRELCTGVAITPHLDGEVSPSTPLFLVMADSIAEIHSSFSASVPAIKMPRLTPVIDECCSTANRSSWCFMYDTSRESTLLRTTTRFCGSLQRNELRGFLVMPAGCRS